MLQGSSVIVFLSFVFFVNVLGHKLNIEGYYWRDYAGKVPKDALPGGVDYNGDPIYMGQIFHNGKITPVKIYSNDNKAYHSGTGTGKEEAGTEFVKILCSQCPERFYWIPTKYDEIHLLVNHHLVIGGHHPEKTFYFGRVHYRTETSVGRVSTSKTKGNLGLYITQNGGEFNFHTFEILAYNNSEPVTSAIQPLVEL